MMNKKGVVPIYIAVTLVASVLTLFYLAGFIDVGSIFGGQNVYVANWGTMECKPSPDFEEVPKYIDDLNKNLITCGINEYTNECEFKLRSVCTAWYCQSSVGKYRICNSDGTGCGGWQSYSLSPNTETTLTKLDRGKAYEFSLGIGTINEDYTIVTKKYHLWKLWSEEEGRDFISGSDGCKLPYYLRDQTKDLTCIEEGQLSFSDSCRVINYMTSWIVTDGKIVTYMNKDAICQARAVYGIDEIKFEDGDTKLIQGDLISRVTCCPHEPNCNNDFEWNPDDIDDCSYDYQCLGTNPVDSTHTRTESCVNGKCEWGSLQSVECTTSAECLRKFGEGHVCDTDYTCIKSQTTNFCGDGYCDSLDGESLETCEEDCACPDGEILVERISKINCVIGFPFYYGCDQRIEKECIDKSDINYVFWISLILGIAILFFFRNQIIGIVKGGLGKLGLG